METAFSLLMTAAGKLVTELHSIRTVKTHNENVVADIEKFRSSLEAGVAVVKEKGKTLQNDQCWAIESLANDLENAKVYLERCRRQGWIEKHWDAKRISTELARLQNNLSHNFLAKLFFTSFEAIIDKEKRTADFHSKLVEQLDRSATHADLDRFTDEMKCLLQPLTMGLRVQDVRYQQIRAEIGALSAPLESANFSSSDTEKFLQDLMLGLAESVSFLENEDEMLYYDPYTQELMCDPVKCDDGKTYDRFTVFKNNWNVQKKPLVIGFSDESLRIRIFDRFRHQQPEKTMRSRRSEYRMKALSIAAADDFGEALVRLDHVLQWAPEDSECLRARDRIRASYREGALSLAGSGDFKEAVDMLQAVQKWFPRDREVFDKLEMIERKLLADSDNDNGRDIQPQPYLRDDDRAMRTAINPDAQPPIGALHDHRKVLKDPQIGSDGSNSMWEPKSTSTTSIGQRNGDVRPPSEIDLEIKRVLEAPVPHNSMEREKGTTLTNLRGSNSGNGEKPTTFESSEIMPEALAAHHLDGGKFDVMRGGRQLSRVNSSKTHYWWERRYYRYLSCLSCHCCLCDRQVLDEDPCLRHTGQAFGPIIFGCYALDCVFTTAFSIGFCFVLFFGTCLTTELGLCSDFDIGEVQKNCGLCDSINYLAIQERFKAKDPDSDLQKQTN